MLKWSPAAAARKRRKVGPALRLDDDDAGDAPEVGQPRLASVSAAAADDDASNADLRALCGEADDIDARSRELQEEGNSLAEVGGGNPLSQTWLMALRLSILTVPLASPCIPMPVGVASLAAGAAPCTGSSLTCAGADGWRALKAGKLGEALGKWEAAIRLTPEQPVLHEQKAQLLLEMGNSWGSIQAATRTAPVLALRQALPLCNIVEPPFLPFLYGLACNTVDQVLPVLRGVEVFRSPSRMTSKRSWPKLE
eukprot:SM000010S04283  [mRNA]  locus=s10:724811:726546:+ [translate_table: standard]